MRILLTGDLGFSADSEEVFGELDTKLLAGHRAARPRPARRDLPLGAGRADAADRRLLRLHRGDGVRLPVREVGRDRLLERHHDPRRADVRGRHRLLPAARLPLPRGAAPDRGQARGDGARRAPHRPDDPRQRADRLAGDADPGARRRPAHLDPRPGGRDRRRLRDGRRADPAAGAADDLRPPRVLAAPQRRRVRPRRHRRSRARASGGASATASSSAPGRRWR